MFDCPVVNKSNLVECEAFMSTRSKMTKMRTGPQVVNAALYCSIHLDHQHEEFKIASYHYLEYLGGHAELSRHDLYEYIYACSVFYILQSIIYNL